MTKTLRFTGLLGMALLAGCGAGVVDGADATSSDSDALSTRTAAYVTVQRDARKCAAPLCGGYWVSQPNHAAAPIYVSGLDFSQSNLGDIDQGKVTSAPDAELVLFAKLGSRDSSTGTRQLVVLDAYRGLPGRTASTVSALFTVQDNGIRCIAAPCFNLTVQKLNSTAKAKTVSTFSVASAAYGFVDQTWLTHRALQGRALVTGSITSGAQTGTGTEQVFDATQVFLHLPETSGPCPALMQLNCAASGQVNVYNRNQDRCEVPAGCVSQGVCPMMMPACPDGYTLDGAAAAPSACMSYSCDPSWVVQ